jgi:murein DD-endopeptidase MepM/ murein hydrolase activator NlpD
MMNRQLRNLGRGLLLLAGVALSGLVVLEATQQRVRAVDLSTDRATRLPQASSAPQPQIGKGAIAKTEALSFNVSSHPKTSALSTGAANDPQQPLSQISPNQVAASVNAWNGASFPVEGFQAYTSPFGYRQSATGGYSQEFHYGLDMAAPAGSYIRNWWSGNVVEVSDDSNCGTSVVVESGNWTHIYCHMEGHVETDSRGRSMIDREGGIQIYEGQQVIAGIRIGRVGMTGRTTGPHLHWGLKYDGNWVDPAYVLRAMYSGQEAAAQATGDRLQ